ncbi:MAG: glutamyl-tRNA(Gln) amidotransferase subunit E [Candidatus Aerophobetes bacterium ADurb.Bin490]|nr:MAG: glutamyl-tRNA(Gln) amidotransferase subunit E [Candidatus Aerophobetes bacterium ADurb.Bin490]HPI02608.1 GatB/YqeY domain-containing protein [Candidatus Goldiibacteriota bacterium]HPN63633.1 GatB/YqeY domain-containing protein [Candidatus Goldiibacteriota bacterium]HRQ43061.1 GatB/YqeY domain-containing protein [Candidatus Goldiibacteriota bacterium]
MSLNEKLAQDLKEAMKAKDETKTAVIRQIKTAVMNAEIKSKKEMTDDDIVSVIFSLSKAHNESIESFTKGNRPELAEKEKQELEIIMSYLPKQLTDDELREIVKETIAAVNAQSAKEMGKVMGAVMPKVKGRADGTKIGVIVKEFLK